jgi:DNA gyrase subunit A
MEIGLVRQIDIDAEMQQSYLDYAMSVIVARALPDARDGLKPVHRRILHAMHAMRIGPDSAFKKSARIVGEVLGKFHPHGDMAVYDAMARMAQDFSMRYPLIEGQGNFGSVDGDPPAAMRYTEARLAPLAMEMLADLDKDTVDFSDNFDGSLLEPQVLPAAVPNMLINGATGIAVGMATSIPPHNLGEVCDALIYMLDQWKKLDSVDLTDLMKFIKGPDFPTGGIVLQEKREEGDALSAAYASGRGRITVQARAHIEAMGRGRSRIIVTELPYQTNKSNLIERIADLARAGQIEGLADLRDESDRQGMRIVLELSKTADAQKVLAQLFRRTPMQTTFSVIMLALVDGAPRLLNLKQALRVYLEHRIEVVRRRSQFELRRARERAHILEGLRVALKNLDEVIGIIRRARDAEQARTRLQKRFKLSERQATAILDMPLRRLASLERKKIEMEYKETMARIKELEGLLRSEAKIRALIAEELTRIKATFGDRRRTLIVSAAKKGEGKKALLTAVDVAPAKDTWVVISREGRISRSPSGRLPRLAGRGAPKLVLGATARDTLYLFTANGQGAALAVHTLPECDKPRQGAPLQSATPLPPGAEVVAGLALPPEARAAPAFLLFITRDGMVKKTPLQNLPGPSARAFTATNISPHDALAWVHLTSGQDEVVLVSRQGMAIRFHEKEVRPMGLAAAGVMGMKLAGEEDPIVGSALVQARADLFLVTEEGEAKRTPLSQFPRQGRYGKGVLAWKSGAGIRLAGAAAGSAESRGVLWLAKGPAKSIRLGDAPRKGRALAGKAILSLKEGDAVTGFTPIFPRPALTPAAKVERPKPKSRKGASKSKQSKKK